MPSARQQFGSWAESRAEDFLRRKGFTIIDRHVTSRYGEIDILAKDGATVVAVEVKARRNEKYGRAIEALTEIKFGRLTNTLHDLLEKSSFADGPIRIDLITIEGEMIVHLRGVGHDLTDE